MIKPVQFACAVLVASALASSAFAQTKDDEHKAHHPETEAAAVAKTKAAPAPARPASAGMHGHMDQRCTEMQKIIKIKDAKQRQKAFDEHMKSMHDDAGCDMMKDGMGGGMGGGVGMGKGMGPGASAPMDMKPGMGK